MNFFTMLDVRDSNEQTFEERREILSNRMMARMSSLFLKVNTLEKK